MKRRKEDEFDRYREHPFKQTMLALLYSLVPQKKPVDRVERYKQYQQAKKEAERLEVKEKEAAIIREKKEKIQKHIHDIYKKSLTVKQLIEEVKENPVPQNKHLLLTAYSALSNAVEKYSTEPMDTSDCEECTSQIEYTNELVFYAYNLLDEAQRLLR